MASTKISALASGAPVLPSDLHVLARSGTNKKLPTADLFSETLTLAAFETKRAASGLVAGRWYRVTGCGPDSDKTLQVQATAPNEYSRHVLWESGFGPVRADWLGLTEWPKLVEDWQGNRYGNWFAGGSFPPFNQGTWENNWLDGSEGNLTVTNFESGQSWGCRLEGGTYAYNNLLTNETTLRKSTLTNNIGSYWELQRCEVLDGSALTNNVDGPNLNVRGCTFKNAEVVFGGDVETTVTNCRFENVHLTITNGATVDGLTILGKVIDGEDTPSYTIDGNYQTSVINNWAGVVVADRYRGSSTVRARVRESSGTNPFDYNLSAKTVYLPDSSVVGIYELSSDFFGVREVQIILDPNSDLWHRVQFCRNPETAARFTVITTTENDLGQVGEVVKPHGASTKLGQLWSSADFIVGRSVFSGSIGDRVWFIVEGEHFD